MSYLNQANRASPGSMAAVVAIHAAMGAALVFGLSVAGTIIEEEGPIIGINLPDPPPPPDTPEPQPKTEAPRTQPIPVPRPPVVLDPTPPIIDTTDIIPPPLPPIDPGLRADPGPIVPPSIPAVEPIAASPRNDPGTWVTDADYRTSWIRRDMVGKARFRLEIAANGRVSDCTITRSTGYDALDQATCRLVSRRARFQPARGPDGEAVAGSYSSAVDWRLPE